MLIYEYNVETHFFIVSLFSIFIWYIDLLLSMPVLIILSNCLNSSSSTSKPLLELTKLVSAFSWALEAIYLYFVNGQLLYLSLQPVQTKGHLWVFLQLLFNPIESSILFLFTSFDTLVGSNPKVSAIFFNL